MEPKKIIDLSNQRMLLVMKYVVDNQTKGIMTNNDFLLSIGFSGINNLWQVRNAKISFQPEHLAAAVTIYNVDGNYFLDKRHTIMFKLGKAITPLQMLKQAVQAVAGELSEKGKK